MPHDAHSRTDRRLRLALRGFDTLVQTAGLATAVVGAWLAWPALALAGSAALFVASGERPWRLRAPRLLPWLALTLVVAGTLAWAVDPRLTPARVPASLIDALRPSPFLGSALMLAFLVWTALRRLGTPPSPDAVLAWLALPLLLKLLGALAWPSLLPDAAHALGLPGPQALQPVLLRALILWSVLECLLNGVGLMMDRRPTLAPRAHLLLGALALGTALAPLWLATPVQTGTAAWPEWARRGIAVPLAALAHAALWASVHAGSGLLIDALAQRRPTFAALHAHALRGALHGLGFGGIVATVLMIGVPLMERASASFAFAGAPVLIGALLAMLAWPLLHGVCDALFTPATPGRALSMRLRQPWTLARGALIGAGAAYAWTLAIPQADALARAAFGIGLGMLSAVAPMLLREGADLLARRRGRLSPASGYASIALCGGVAGALAALYANAAQLALLAQNLRGLASVDAVVSMPGLAFWLPPAFVLPDLGAPAAAASGPQVLFAWAVSGLIGALLLAPLLIVLHAVPAPRVGAATNGGARLALRTTRWSLWLAPLLALSLAPLAEPPRGLLATLSAPSMDAAPTPAHAELLAWFWLDQTLLCLLAAMLGARLTRGLERRHAATRSDEPVPAFAGLRVLLVAAGVLALHGVVDARLDVACDPAMIPTLLMSHRALFAFAGLALFLWALRARRRITTSAPVAPSCIGNGEYELRLHADGRGHSRCPLDADATRWLALTTPDPGLHAPRGPFLYFRETDARGQTHGAGWSLTHEPARYGVATVERPAPTRLQVTRSQAGLRIQARIEVLREAPVECWTLHLRNTTPQARILDLCSTLHPALHAEDEHPPPLESLWIAAAGVLVWRWREAAPGSPWLFHALLDGAAEGYQDELAAFTGPANLRDPLPAFHPAQTNARRHPARPLSALHTRVRLPAHGDGRWRMAAGHATCATSLLRALRRVRTLDARQTLAIREALVHPPAPTHDAAPPHAHWSADGTRLTVDPHAARPQRHLIADANGHGWSVRADGVLHALHESDEDALPEYLLIRDLDQGGHHGPLRWPLADPASRYRAEFGARDALFVAAHPALHSRLRIWADAHASLRYRELTVRNPLDTPRRLRVFWQMPARIDAVPDAATDARIQVWRDQHPGVEFIAVSAPQPRWARYPHAAQGTQDDPLAPALLIRGRAPSMPTDEPASNGIAWCSEIELPPHAEQRAWCVTGHAATPEQAQVEARAQATAERVDAALAALTRAEPALHVRSTRPDIDRLINDWLPAALFAACAKRAASACVDVRGLDDVLAQMLIDAPGARRALLRHAALQRRDGMPLSCVRIHAEDRLQVLPAAPDPLAPLRLVRAVLDYVQASGDAGVLDAPLSFVEGTPRLRRSRDTLPLYQHLRLALECALRRHRQLGLAPQRVAQAREALLLAYTLIPLLRACAELARERDARRAAERWQAQSERLRDALSLQPRLDGLTPPAQTDATLVRAVIAADVLDTRRALELLERAQAALESCPKDMNRHAALELALAWLHFGTRAEARHDAERAARARARALAAWLRSWPRDTDADVPLWQTSDVAILALQLRVGHALFGVRLHQGRWVSGAAALTVVERVVRERT